MSEPIPFRGFNEHGKIRVYSHGILPHWRQDGCTYFVTFRLADSVPAGVLREWEAERTAWLQRHGIGPSRRDWQRAFQQLALADRREYERSFGKKLDDFLDSGHGSCLLGNPDIGKLVANALAYFHCQRVLTGDYVVMPNHVHAIMKPLEGDELEDLLQAIKSFTAHEINRLGGTEGQVWQKESYDHIIRDFDQLERFHDYVHGNPRKASLNPEQYVLSECAKYVEA